ncbi:hypothetical protein [Actinotalea solisilvae]|uniref:hypothetical protein n=1 Tax=Actinotalea solisilvae TaxID=2072922 RepID=UPI0018F1B0A9|nr:hypothetical protein [Actinotalea solisilvae]
MSEEPVRAQLGHPAEAEVPRHVGEPGREDPRTTEETAAYELAVEDGRPLPPEEARGLGGGDAPEPGPLFREPGA